MKTTCHASRLVPDSQLTIFDEFSTFEKRGETFPLIEFSSIFHLIFLFSHSQKHSHSDKKSDSLFALCRCRCTHTHTAMAYRYSRTSARKKRRRNNNRSESETIRFTGGKSDVKFILKRRKKRLHVRDRACHCRCE